MKLRSITTFAIVALAAVLWAMPNNSAIADGDGNDNGNHQSWKAIGAGFGVTMESSYEESTNRNGTIDQKLEVDVHNAPANIMVDVILNGVNIGTLRTTREGEGQFTMVKYGSKAGADGRPTGARIDTGDVIDVASGSASIGGTFQKDQGDNGNGDGDNDGNGDNDGDGDGGHDGDNG